MRTAQNTISSQSTNHLPSAENPWGLVYAGAITENLPGKVNLHPVAYDLNSLRISANLYLPADFNDQKLYPAIVVAHPNGGCKEQVAGLYAQRLAKLGYITLAFDAAYQGASEGEPRNTDKPQYRVEDIHGAIDYLDGLKDNSPTTGLKNIDHSRIGILGICGGGGYTLRAAQTDKRIKAVATLSAFNTGIVRKNGFLDSQINTITERLKEACVAREAEQRGDVRYTTDMLDMSPEAAAKLPFDLYRDGYEYYGVTHRHPNSTFRYTVSSLIDLVGFDARDGMEMIDQPLLMIAGKSADTLYLTEGCYERATGTKQKELFLIDGATHIQTYWVPEYVNQVVNKLKEFYAQNL